MTTKISDTFKARIWKWSWYLIISYFAAEESSKQNKSLKKKESIKSVLLFFGIFNIQKNWKGWDVWKI